GTFHPQRMEPTWFSKEYYNSPMPHSIFFHGGFAIHGSYEISQLGGPASHGCIRLHPDNAATLYGLVEQQGMEATTIVVSGELSTRRRPSAENGEYPPAAPGTYGQRPAPTYPPPYQQPYYPQPPRGYYNGGYNGYLGSRQRPRIRCGDPAPPAGVVEPGAGGGLSPRRFRLLTSASGTSARTRPRDRSASAW